MYTCFGKDQFTEGAEREQQGRLCKACFKGGDGEKTMNSECKLENSRKAKKKNQGCKLLFYSRIISYQSMNSFTASNFH